MSFTYEPDANELIRVGQIIVHNRKKHKVTKVTKTAIAVSRYYWWNAAWDSLVARLGVS